MLADWSGQGTGSESAGVETSAGSAGSSEEEKEEGGGGGGGGGSGLSSDGSLPTDADFASAVARAAELSGMTVVGTTVTDPKANGKKRSFVGRGGGGGRVQANLGVMLRVGYNAERVGGSCETVQVNLGVKLGAGEPCCKAEGCGAVRQCR